MHSKDVNLFILRMQGIKKSFTLDCSIFYLFESGSRDGNKMLNHTKLSKNEVDKREATIRMSTWKMSKERLEN